MELTSFLLGVFHLCMFISFCHCQGHYENVALNKPCDMSSQQHAQPNCSGAVNGNTTGRYMANGDNCIRTNPSENSSWWEVNLGRPYPVCNITIWFRLSEQDRMVGVKVLIDGSEYYEFKTTPLFLKLTIYCTTPLTGTVIRLSKDATRQQSISKDNTIDVCEVEVLSCSDAYWGLRCNNLCGNCGNNEVCDKVTGRCTSCHEGWELPMCSVCSDGYWGSECNQKCGNCSNNEACDKVTGHCTTCSARWKPPLCAGCSDGYWGSECNQKCGNCSNNEVCDKVTGRCTTCSARWKPPLCAVCKDGYWGSECNKKCGNCSNNEVCDKVTGHCPSCSPGWKPPLCDTVCEDGSWGTNCEDRCGNCSNGEVCDKVTGHCSDCSPGFVLPLCLPVSSREGDQASVGHVVGAAVGGVAALALTVALVFLLVRRHRSLQQQRTDAHVAGARDTTETVAPTIPGRVDPQLPSGEPQAQEADPTGNSRMSTASAYIELMEDPSVYDRLAVQRNQHIYAGLQNS